MELHWNCSGFSANFIMRRTAIILAIAALLCGSAAYGSKKPRESVASTSQKKAKHSAKHAERRKAAQCTTLSFTGHAVTT